MGAAAGRDRAAVVCEGSIALGERSYKPGLSPQEWLPAAWQDGRMSHCEKIPGFAGQAMILAAGRGERMRPLTDLMPKPLLRVRGQPLVQWPLQGLARGGFTRVLVNTAWLGEQIPAHLGAQWQGPGLPAVQLRYSHEGRDFGRALETAGGILRALPMLDEVFWVT